MNKSRLKYMKTQTNKKKNKFSFFIGGTMTFDCVHSLSLNRPFVNCALHKTHLSSNQRGQQKET